MSSIYVGKIGVVIFVWLMHLVCTLKQIKYADQISWLAVDLHIKQSYPKWSECLSFVDDDHRKSSLFLDVTVRSWFSYTI